MDDHPKGEDFCLHVVDVFVISGRGTVITGPIESGILRTGDIVEIWDGDRLVATAEATVEMACSHTADPRTIALRLGVVDRTLLKPGQVARKRRTG